MASGQNEPETTQNLETKLKNARHLLDLEKGKRIAVENEKRDFIKFAKTCLKCRDCWDICHTKCREQVPLPCVPSANTPNSKEHMLMVKLLEISSDYWN